MHIARRTVWRVPALLTSPSKGLRGQVGFVDIDAETGEALVSDELRYEILSNVKSIANTDSALSTNRHHRAVWHGASYFPATGILT